MDHFMVLVRRAGGISRRDKTRPYPRTDQGFCRRECIDVLQQKSGYASGG